MAPARSFVSRTAALVATAAALALAVSGCALIPLLPFPPDSGGTTDISGAFDPTEGIDEALWPYYEQSVDWSDCGDGFECGFVTAPMNWADPDPSSDIQLAVVRHQATGDKLGSLMINPGGPGASGFAMVRDSLDFAVSGDLQERFDIVGWDPRGVGRSDAVSCYDGEGMDEFIFGTTEASPDDTEAWVAEATEISVDFGAACAENTGELLQYIDTVSTVRDLDLLRAVTGDPKLNYLGYSYGSDIGATYVDLFPERVGRVVLDGATDSSLSLFEVGLEQNAGFELALTNYVTQCPELFEEECPFVGDAAADLGTIRALFDRYDASPVTAPDGRVMDAGVLDIAISMALYSQDSWSFLNDLFFEAEAGETDTAFFLADYYYGRTAPGVYEDNSLEAFLAIYCVDYPVETDPAVLAEQSVLRQEASPTTYREFPVTPDLTCLNWPYHYLGDGPDPVTGTGAPPVLVVSTTGDPATPYEWGVALADQLESGVLVTFNGEGHTAYSQGNACIVSTVDDYFIDGTVPESDPNCS